MRKTICWRHIGRICGANKMGFIERLEKNIAKLEKRIEKEEEKIRELHEKLESKKITKAEFNLKKRHIEDKVNAMKARIRILQGGMAKEKRHLEEKKKEKEEKKKKKSK